MSGMVGVEFWQVAGIGLLALVVMVGVAGFYVWRLITKFKVVQSDLMPVGGKVAFWAALAYTLLPIDVLADPILLDDIAVLVGAVTYINHLIGQFGDDPHRDGSPGDGGFDDPGRFEPPPPGRLGP